MSVLVTGGAGYIGSATVELLLAKGEKVVVLDNLSRGHREAVRAGVPFYQGDLRDQQLVARIAREHASGAIATRFWCASVFITDPTASP